MWSLFAVLSACLLQTVLSAPLRAQTCNSSPELCTRSYSNVTYLGSHDSYAVSKNPLDLGRNQEISLTDQLNMGVRMLQAQGHMDDGQLKFCHTSCTLFDGGTVLAYLQTVKTWLDSNPDDVLTLLFTNGDGVGMDVWKGAFDSAGLTPLAYVPPTTPLAKSSWPTLQAMLDSGKKIVVFMDAGADTSVANFILPEFNMIWEPPFDSTDDSFPCSVDRGGTDGTLSLADKMYLLNHFLDFSLFGIMIPDRDSAPDTNSVDSISANAAGCTPLSHSNSKPTYVLLDWVNVGQGVAAVNALNGL